MNSIVSWNSAQRTMLVKKNFKDLMRKDRVIKRPNIDSLDSSEDSSAAASSLIEQSSEDEELNKLIDINCDAEGMLSQTEAEFTRKSSLKMMKSQNKTKEVKFSENSPASK